jgi:hypothetical protein
MTRRRRRRKRRSRAVKTWRFIMKHRRRRKRLHPTRRKQETTALLGGLALLPLLLFIGIPAAVFVGVASAGVGVASKGSPPRGSVTHKARRIQDLPKMSGKDAIKLTKGHPCDKTCKYSTHDVSTCVCSCGGKQHGIWALGGANTTMPQKRKPRRRSTTRRPARRRVRSRS